MLGEQHARCRMSDDADSQLFTRIPEHEWHGKHTWSGLSCFTESKKKSLKGAQWAQEVKSDGLRQGPPSASRGHNENNITPLHTLHHHHHHPNQPSKDHYTAKTLMIHFQVCAQTTIFGVSLKDNRLVLSSLAQAEPKQKCNHSVRKNTNILLQLLF